MGSHHSLSAVTVEQHNGVIIYLPEGNPHEYTFSRILDVACSWKSSADQNRSLTMLDSGLGGRCVGRPHRLKNADPELGHSLC